MFLADPIVWLQTWASPVLTRIMAVVSLFGYTRTAIALAVLVTFGFRPRVGMAILLMLCLNSIAIDLAKTAAALPRPFAVDTSVRILGWPAPAPIRWGTAATTWWDVPKRTPAPSAAVAGGRANAADSETGFGFPSGHVSTTFTLVAGLSTLVGGRWIRLGGLIWLLLMALSRLYLGRHFVGDVLGGVALGAVIVVLGATVLRLRAFADGRPAEDSQRAAAINTGFAMTLLAWALFAGVPDVGDAGRFGGVAAACAVLTRAGLLSVPAGPVRRAGLVALAAATYVIVWGALTFGLTASRPSVDAVTRVGDRLSTGGRLVAAMVPAFAMLVVPAATASRGRIAASVPRTR